MYLFYDNLFHDNLFYDNSNIHHKKKLCNYLFFGQKSNEIVKLETQSCFITRKAFRISDVCMFTCYMTYAFLSVT